MSKLNELKMQLTLLEEKKRELLLKWKKEYELGEEYKTTEDIEDALYGGEILPEWYDLRDMEYLDGIITINNLLVRAIQMYEESDNKSLHDVNKAIENLVTDARRIKGEKKADIKKAQDVVDAMDGILKICEEYRK